MGTPVTITEPDKLPKLKMKFSANLSFMFTDLPSLLDRYKAAKEAGFSAVEEAFPYDEDKDLLAKTKDSLGLEQVLLNTKVGPSLGHGARKGEESQFLESIKTSLEYCSALQVTRLHIMAGYRQAQTGRRQLGLSETTSGAACLSWSRLAWWD